MPFINCDNENNAPHYYIVKVLAPVIQDFIVVLRPIQQGILLTNCLDTEAPARWGPSAKSIAWKWVRKSS